MMHIMMDAFLLDRWVLDYVLQRHLTSSFSELDHVQEKGTDCELSYNDFSCLDEQPPPKKADLS